MFHLKFLNRLRKEGMNEVDNILGIPSSELQKKIRSPKNVVQALLRLQSWKNVAKLTFALSQ